MQEGEHDFCEEMVYSPIKIDLFLFAHLILET